MKLSKLIAFIALTMLWAYNPASAQQVNSFKLKKIVIDPGHGGKDPGTVYGNYKEKEIVLKVALKLGALINARYPDVEVVYTRKTDVFIPLHERTDIANKAGADLFISIHVNSAKNRSASGTETFVMGVDKSDDNLDVAMAENSVITFEEDYRTKYEGYDPESAESFIIFSLMQYSYQEQSLHMASMIQDQYTAKFMGNDRGVKQRGFLVIWRTTMPSVLTELGFLSNENDRKILTSQNGHDEMANALFNAFSQYKGFCEKTSLIAVNDHPEQTEAVPPTRKVQPAVDAGNILFRIQIRTSQQRLSTSSASFFNVYRNKVTEIKTGSLYKYYVFESKSYEEIVSLLSQVKKRFSDAFIAAFDGNQPIDIQKALEATK